MVYNSLGPRVSLNFLCAKYISVLLQTKFQVRQNALSSVRSRSTTTRKAGNLATILIVIGFSHHLPPPCVNLIPQISLTLMIKPILVCIFIFLIKRFASFSSLQCLYFSSPTSQDWFSTWPSFSSTQRPQVGRNICLMFTRKIMMWGDKVFHCTFEEHDCLYIL